LLFLDDLARGTGLGFSGVRFGDDLKGESSKGGGGVGGFPCGLSGCRKLDNDLALLTLGVSSFA
jgi:hypothetical protein